MSVNCPFCPDDPNMTPQSWGYGPSGWQQARETHDKYHCEKCPHCGEPRLKEPFLVERVKEDPDIQLNK